MSGTLAKFASWALTVRCPKCRRQRVLPVADLLVVCDGDQVIGPLIGKLRCSTPICGMPPDQVEIANHRVMVVLIGQGAF